MWPLTFASNLTTCISLLSSCPIIPGPLFDFSITGGGVSIFFQYSSTQRSHSWGRFIMYNVPLMFLPGRSLLVLVYMLDHCLYCYATKCWTIAASCAFTKVPIIISRAEMSLIKMQNEAKKKRNTDHPLLPSTCKSWLTSETILPKFAFRCYSQSAITFVTSDSISLLFPSTLVNICIIKFLWCWNAAMILETSPGSVESAS